MSAAGLAPSPRQHCPRCARAACICAALAQPGVPVASAVALLILQHPREQHEAKGTARLLHLAVAGSALCVGEAWPAPPWRAHGDAPPRLSGWPAAQAQAHGAHGAQPPGWPSAERTLLLYPPTPGDAALPPPPPVPPGWLEAPAGLRLVVIDGTWRKSRRMLYSSPWLQSLPRLALHAPPPSRYAIRRARGEGQRSTFEAAVLALQALGQPVAALWPVFDAFVAQQQALAQGGRPG